MNDLKELLGFPFEDRQWFLKLIIGSVIAIVPILNFISLGYFLRCIKYGWTGRRTLPEWHDWGELFRDGCLGAVIILAYLILPLMCGWIMSVLPLVGTFLAAILILILSLVIPMALASYAIQKEFRDAFMLRNILIRAGKVLNYYLTAYLAAVLAVVIGIALLVGVPIIGFLGGLLIFYAGVVFFNLVGFLFYKAG